MVHVFVVNDTTFKYHLEYMFAGTGAKDKMSKFLYNPTINFNSSTERNLVGMIADISRIRENDKIVFYLTASQSHQGMFFGTFKVVNQPFFDENDGNNFLMYQMEKGLSYRVAITPDIVYQKSVTEHQYLDSLYGIDKISDMCWSLIYRKLKGNRGCTMITDKEYDRLVKLLNQANNNTPLITPQGCGFTFDSYSTQILITDKTNEYLGRKAHLDIKERLIYKFNNNKAFESHLQAYILQNIDKEPLKSLILKPLDNLWLGNEVSCGVGMQRIDILTLQEDEENVYANIIELKCREAYSDIITNQLPWYINWFNDYKCPTFNKKIIIQPIVLTYETIGVTSKAIVKCENLRDNVELMPVKNIFFKIENKDITFRIL